MIVNKGIQDLVNFLKGQSWKIAVGTGSTPAWYENETLENEIDRDDAVTTLATTNLANDTIVFDATFNWAETKNITEYGLIANYGGVFLFSRCVLSVIEVPTAEDFPVQFQLVIKRD